MVHFPSTHVALEFLNQREKKRVERGNGRKKGGKEMRGEGMEAEEGRKK